MAVMFCPEVVNCCSCNVLTFPDGYKIFTSTPFTPKNPLATALPVSPDVATKIQRFWSSSSLKTDTSLAINLAPKSLKAMVGP